MPPPDGAAIAIPELARTEVERAETREPGVLEHLSLDTRRATALYWGSIVLLAAALFVPRLLPCVDYPQHLALADVARRLADPAAPEQATHQLNYFTYNGLFHVLVAKLGHVLPIELAGRIVVSSSLVLLGGAVLALLRVLRRPAIHAALFVPVIFSFAVGWGFVNYALGTALAMTASVFVARSLVKPTAGSLVATALVGLVCAMTHVLAMLLLCLFAASLAPEVAWRWVQGETRARKMSAWLLRMVVALAPLLVGSMWCIAVYREQYAWDPAMYKDATLEGTSPPIVQKLLSFGSWATGIHSDFTDQGLVALSLVVLLGSTVAGVVRRIRGGSYDGAAADPREAPLVLPFVALLAAYLATPMVFIGTHLIFPRLTQAVVLGAVLLAPRAPERLFPRVRFAALTLGALAGVNLFAHSILFAAETDDASRVIDDLPAGRRATGVVFGANTFSFRHGTLVHVAAYYAARKHGDWAFSFARYLSVPVRFRPGGGPPWPKMGWEFEPLDYNPRCKYARTFDLVIVKAPRDFPREGPEAEAKVRRLVFGRDADAVRLVSHHGAYWGFDTHGLPDDGTF